MSIVEVVTRPPVFAPMLASSGRAPTGPGVVIEPKWDGCRAITTIHDGTVVIRSRNGRDVSDCYPELGHLPSHLADVSVVVDGEIIAVGPSGLADFQRLQQRMNRRRPNAATLQAVPVIFVVFDLLWIHGEDLTRLPLSQRRRRLETLLHDPPEQWQLTPRLDVELNDELIDSFRDAGIEGVIVKGDVAYQPGTRSKQWIKIKARQRRLAVIGGFLIDKPRTQLGSFALGIYGPDGLHYVGQIGLGSLPRAHAEQLDQFLRAHTIDTPPFIDLDSPAIQGVEPVVVVEVDYAEVTAIGTFRQPVMQRIVLDTPATGVTLDDTFRTAVCSRTSVHIGSGQRL